MTRRDVSGVWVVLYLWLLGVPAGTGPARAASGAGAQATSASSPALSDRSSASSGSGPITPPGLAAAREIVDGDPASALVLLHPLLQAPVTVPDGGARPRTQSDPFRLEAAMLTGRALAQLDLQVLALLHYQTVLEAPHSKFTARVFGEAVRLSRVVHNDMPLSRAARSIDVAELKGPDQGYAFYLVGGWLESADELSDAASMLNRVSKGHPDYVHARLLLAGVFTRLRQRAMAVATLDDLLVSSDGLLSETPDLKDRVTLNLARALYGAGQLDRAIDVYTSLPKPSPVWLEGQVELAWAYYRRFAENGDLDALNDALGTLVTVNSPFFARLYLPEPALLEAQILYQLCRFVDGTRRVEAFLQRYSRRRDVLASALAGLAPGDDTILEAVLAYRRFRLHAGPQPETALPTSVLDQQLERPSLDQLELHLQVLALEDVRLQSFRGTWDAPILERLDALLNEHRDTVKSAYDRTLGAEMRHTLHELEVMMNQARLVQLDMVTAEKELYEAAAAGTLPTATLTKRRKRRRWPVASRHVWPFEGEYWVDELGTFDARAVPLCPE